MRKRITKNLLTAVALCTALSAEAYDFEAGGIYYNITSETDKTVEVTFGNNSYSGDIAIPSTVSNGASTYTVTLIGSSAFESCVDITSIAMPEGVTGIGRTAFLFCSGLISVNIPKGVTEIGDYAFEGCERLTEINCLATVPPTCGNGCFSGVDKDKCTLNVPVGTEDAYKAAKGWKEFMYEDYFTVDGIRYAITSSELRTVEVIAGDNKYTGNIEIPATVSYGGTTYAVTSVGESAFEECVSLISINIPNSVVSIGENAFSWCSSLSSVNIPSGVTRIENGTFFGCSSLTSTNIPEGVTSIGEDAFYLCTSLASITIPNSVTIIGDYAFSDCSSLTSINIPEGVTSIGEYAFYGCNALESVTINCETVGSYFSGIKSLKSVVLGDNVKTIEGGAFQNCSSLTSINIPDGVTSIESSTFSGCSSLTSITIPESVTSIGYSAFSYCSSLASVTLGNGLETIGSSAFSGCSSLASVTIPESVTSIGYSAFSGCSSLASATIPESVTSIGDFAFFGCSSLTEINSLATVPPVCSSWCFYEVDTKACILNVPEGTADAYKTADGWKDFTNIVETDFAGSEEIAAEAAADVRVYAAAGRIVVENAAAGTPIAVYSADGMLIYSGTVSDAFTEIPAPAGKLYIVKCGNAVFKTVM